MSCSRTLTRTASLEARRSFITVAILLTLPLAVLGQTAAEYAIKASYLARFVEFVQWPEGAITDEPSAAFVVSVLGDAPFEDMLESTFAAQPVGNATVEVRFISSVEESVGSQVLFVSRSEENRLEEILSFTAGSPILTVSDTEDFASRGVMVNFYIEGDAVRFEINRSALEDTGLSINSLVLSYARLVGPQEGVR